MCWLACIFPVQRLVHAGSKPRWRHIYSLLLPHTSYAWCPCRGNTAEDELQRYRLQYQYIQQICELYESNPSDTGQLFKLVEAMQACGNPPSEIVDEMTPGLSFDGDGLPNFAGGLQGELDMAKCVIS